MREGKNPRTNLQIQIKGAYVEIRRGEMSMAHERIIQIEKCPISDVGKTTADGIIWRDYDRWFLGSVADYVRYDEYHDETIELFIQYLCSFGPYVEVFNDEEEQWLVFKEGFIQAYFAKLFPIFKEALQKLVDNASVETLCGYELSALLYPLNEINYDRGGTYIDSIGKGLVPLNYFIREIEPNVRYYIGGTVDYHF